MGDSLSKLQRLTMDWTKYNMSNKCALRLKHPHLYTEPTPGHLHQGDILISWGFLLHHVCGGEGGLGGKRAICDRVQ